MKRKDTSHYIDQKEIGEFLVDVRKYNVLSRMEEQKVIKRIRDGDEKAKEVLIYSNFRYVISTAKQYMNQGLPLSDLISEGNIGLINAAKRFNYEREDIRFLSYAVWWIKQAIVQSLNENSRTIRLPTNIINDMYKSNKEFVNENSDTFNEYGYLPVVQPLDAEMDEDGHSLYDIIADPSSPKPDHMFDNEKENLKNAMFKAMKDLTEIERIIINDYFGLNGDPLTLQQLAEDLDMTKERVRQIKEKALKKIRNSSYIIFDLL